MRIVLDTNVLIDGFQDDFSAQARLIDAVREGSIEAVMTKMIEKGYRKILRRLIRDKKYAMNIKDFLLKTKVVEPCEVNTVIDDEEDRKFLEAAVGGGASVLITNDRHLLDVGEVGNVQIVTPQEAWNRFEDEEYGQNTWRDFARGLGIRGKRS